MTPQSKKVVAVLLLALLALPTGMCSLFHTPTGITALSSHDGLEWFVGVVSLILSGIGWLICGLSIWGAVRLIRTAKLEGPPTDATP